MLLQAIFEYSWHVNPHVDEKKLVEHLEPEASQAMLSYAEKVKQEAHARGVKQGVKQGVEQGVEQGQRELLLEQLTRRFGPLPQTVTTRVARGKSADLRRWGLRILDASSLDEVFRRR